jgi:hypothetical protein
LRVFKGKTYEQHYREFEATMLRELSEVDDEIYLLKKKHHELDKTIRNHVGKNFEKNRIAINIRKNREEYRAQLNKIYEQHNIFKNMERQIFLMNIANFKKEEVRKDYQHDMEKISILLDKELNYENENHHLERSSDTLNVDSAKIFIEHQKTRRMLAKHFAFKKESTKLQFKLRYQKQNNQFLLHRKLAHKYRKQLSVEKTERRGE